MVALAPNSPNDPNARVLATNPQAGQEVDKGSTVTLFVAPTGGDNGGNNGGFIGGPGGRGDED